MFLCESGAGVEPRQEEALRVAIERRDGRWHAVMERRGETREFESLDELIRMLERLALETPRVPRGLR